MDSKPNPFPAETEERRDGKPPLPKPQPEGHPMRRKSDFDGMYDAMRAGKAPVTDGRDPMASQLGGPAWGTATIDSPDYKAEQEQRNRQACGMFRQACAMASGNWGSLAALDSSDNLVLDPAALPVPTGDATELGGVNLTLRGAGWTHEELEAALRRPFNLIGCDFGRETALAATARHDAEGAKAAVAKRLEQARVVTGGQNDRLARMSDLHARAREAADYEAAALAMLSDCLDKREALALHFGVSVRSSNHGRLTSVPLHLPIQPLIDALVRAADEAREQRHRAEMALSIIDSQLHT